MSVAVSFLISNICVLSLCRGIAGTGPISLVSSHIRLSNAPVGAPACLVRGLPALSFLSPPFLALFGTFGFYLIESLLIFLLL